MKEGAYIPPIDVSVKDGAIIIRDGHCRTRAALRLVDEGVAYLLEARQVRGNEIDHVIHMLGSDQGRKFSSLDAIREHGSAAEQVLVRAIDNAEQAGKTKATKKHIDKPKSKPAAILLIDEAVSIIESRTDAHALKEELQEWTPKAKAVLEKYA